jgi:orotate phosphoribosyltransferase
LSDTAALLEWVKHSGALQNGHFKLASGLHASRFFRCIKLFQDPNACEALFIELARRFQTHSPDVVMGANEAGSILAFELAKQLGAKVVIARQSQEDQRYRLIEGFELARDCRVLVVDDITTTGGTVKQLLEIVRQASGIPVGVGLVATKGIFAIDLGCPTEVILELQGMDAVDPQDCPLCQQGIPLKG